MTTKIATRRQIRRYRVDPKAAAVEFSYPNPNGRDFNQPLIDISIAGFSFHIENPVPDIDHGEQIEEAVVRLGDCEIKGDIIIMHLTNEGSRTLCGALFYPSDESELVKLKCVVAGIEALGGV